MGGGSRLGRVKSLFPVDTQESRNVVLDSRTPNGDKSGCSERRHEKNKVPLLSHKSNARLKHKKKTTPPP